MKVFQIGAAFPEAARGGEPKKGFEHNIAVKKAADAHLAATDLNWLIVRPGLLLDAPGTGTVSAAPALVYGDVPRDDVAAFSPPRWPSPD